METYEFKERAGGNTTNLHKEKAVRHPEMVGKVGFYFCQVQAFWLWKVGHYAFNWKSFGNYGSIIGRLRGCILSGVPNCNVEKGSRKKAIFTEKLIIQ